MPDMEAIKDALFGVIKTYGQDFLDRHADAEAFVKERSERLAKLAFLYATNEDSMIREGITSSMNIVRQSIENELSGVALDASAEAKAAFARVLGVAFDTVIKLTPLVVKAVGL
jgi:hypothetical protein